jgi:P-type conjugative transfer protein TrbG
MSLLLALAAATVASSPADASLPRTIVASSPVANSAYRHSRKGYRPAAPDPVARVAEMNAAARLEPSPRAGANAIQVYPFEEGALYEIYAAPGAVSDIVLQPGEQLSATGPVAAGDTVRWVIGNTESGSGTAKRVHILVKPTGANLKTNLVINTDRRTYHLELKATPATYMASVAWKYPPEPVVTPAPPPAPPPVPPPIESMNFAYKIKGDHPPWRPVRVYDDGRQTVIEFPTAVAQTEMPPVFVDGPDGKPTSLVNYRVSGQRIVVDRLFNRAELKLGQGGSQQKVDIERTRRP